MAIRLLTCTSPGVVILSQDSDKVVGRRRSRLMMCAKNSVSKIRSFHLIKNKVFEDRSAGIVCYKDENGDITCEGYDEGPRFHQKISTFSRDVEIVDLLQRCWIHHAYDENKMDILDKEHKDFGVKKHM